MDHFSLIIEKAKQFDIYGDSSAIIDFENNPIREYRMNVRRICMVLCNVAESYYKDNRDKFHFNYEIIDWDEVTSHLPPLNMEKFFAELIQSDNIFYHGEEMSKDGQT